MSRKITIKFLSDAFLIIVLMLVLFYNQLIIYGLKMGKGQLHIVLQARPIDECLADKQFPDSLKTKLLLVKEIRKYAIDSLGLTDSPNYTTVYDQQNKPAIWVLTACEPYALKPKEWKFPIVGIVPYTGFFKKEEGQLAQAHLLSEGYDTKLGTTSGWSTLGWFKDPILSNMLYQSAGDIANLIIHEFTHSTIFIRNDIQHDENLANFIGDMGAKKFLEHKYGIHSTEYAEYINQQADELTYNRYILDNLKKLDSLYNTLSVATPVAEKKKRKEKMIMQIVAGVSHLQLKDKLKYFRISKRAITCKNAFFMEFIRYDSKHDYFTLKLKSEARNNLSFFIQQQKKQADSYPL